MKYLGFLSDNPRKNSLNTFVTVQLKNLTSAPPCNVGTSLWLFQFTKVYQHWFRGVRGWGRSLVSFWFSQKSHFWFLGLWKFWHGFGPLLLQCSNYFFRGLSEWNSKFFIWIWFFSHNFKTKYLEAIKFGTYTNNYIINIL